MAQYIINEKKFDENTSELLISGGIENAPDPQSGQLRVYRSKKGVLWGTHKYWPTSFGPQTIITFNGDEQTEGILKRYGSVKELEKVFGEVEEG